MAEQTNEKGSVKVQEAETLSAQAIMTKLAQAGFRYSRPRWLLAEYIARKGAEGTDFTIDGLWHEVGMHHTGIGRSTVFRLVEALVRVNVVDRVTFSDGSTRYHVIRGEGQQYMICERCHKVVELEPKAASYLLHTLAHLAGFILSQHHIEISGLCPDCQRQ